MEPPDLEDLPRAYRIGLRLQELGADGDLIGECLGIDPAGVATLIEIGRQKLAAGHQSGQLGLADSDPDSQPQRVIPDD
jgi:hypothetical protein